MRNQSRDEAQGNFHFHFLALIKFHWTFDEISQVIMLQQITIRYIMLPLDGIPACSQVMDEQPECGGPPASCQTRPGFDLRNSESAEDRLNQCFCILSGI